MIAQLKQKPALTLDVEQQRRAVYYAANAAKIKAEQASHQRQLDAQAAADAARAETFDAATRALSEVEHALVTAQKQFVRAKNYLQTLSADPKTEPSRPQQYFDNRQDKHGSHSFSASEESTSVLSKIK
jgi:hypothetical protein